MGCIWEAISEGLRRALKDPSTVGGAGVISGHGT